MLERLKNILGVSDDADLESIIAEGKAYLEGLAGVALDFEVEGLPRSLLLDFCRYSYNNASEYFEENFAKEILRMQLQAAVIDYVENQV